MSTLGPNLSIRVWGGDLAPYHSYSFDFVNAEGQYICPPKDIKIYADRFGEVLSIEESFRRLRNNSRGFDRSMQLGLRPGNPDLDWETYIVPEGVRLCIKQEGYKDRFLVIPTRDSGELLIPVRMRQV